MIIEKIKKDFLAELAAAENSAKLEELEQDFFSRRSGRMTEAMKSMKELDEDAKKEFGTLINELKREMVVKLEEKKNILDNIELQGAIANEAIDITAPKLPAEPRGHTHPNTQVQNDLEDFFVSMGFMVLDGPELESDYYNFTAVNIPLSHPARDMQDTFYIKGHGMDSDSPWVMRTHTSTMQVRAMKKYGAPLRMITPGKCYRNEATDVRHEHTFYQLEGVVINKDITFAHLKGVLESVAKHLYGAETRLRLRPKFYPFVEPGVNGEVACFLCKGNGCRLCKQTGWLEIFGAGMIHPNVLKEGNIDPNVYQGFAFGLGLTRLVMLKYGIEDVRLLESGDLRFLEQF